MWIKICGMTTPGAVAAALAAQVDALGFVFADSPRQLTLADAAMLAAPARGKVRCVAVTRHPSQRQVDELLRAFRPDVLQTDIEDLQTLEIPSGLEVLPVLRSAPIEDALPRRVLFEGPRSGAGQPCDWTAAAQLARRTQLVLAGGLNGDNVATAVAAVRPFGVDVSSGVEERPGVKDLAEVARFASTARAAFASINTAELT